MPSATHIYYLLSASHREGVTALLSQISPCPGLFYPTPAQDGLLYRIRIPGGMLNSQQLRAIANIADQYGGNYADVTNRANLQIRELSQDIHKEVLKSLQDLGLAARNPAVDHIRNIMTSPTASIDLYELIDTRPFVQGWENYITAHPELSRLSAKFSVCFDGGGIVSVCDAGSGQSQRLNDITLAAVLVDGQVYFRLHLSVGAGGEPPRDTGILLPTKRYLPVLAALTDIYLEHTDITSKRKLRLRDLLNTLGSDNYLQQVQQRLPFSLFVHQQRQDLTYHVSTKNYQHIGIHPQRQADLFYIGVVLPLGRLETFQMRGLANLAAKYGSANLRLTPWQNLLITDIPQQWVADVKREIAALGLDCSPRNINSALVACSGNTGCAASATDTKSDALALAEYISTHVTLNHPINIHLSGCSKSCAQHSQSEITLLGVTHHNNTGYRVYVGDGESNQQFGRELYPAVTTAELPKLLEQMLQVYQRQRIDPHETFREFTNRHAIAQLKHLFTLSTLTAIFIFLPLRLCAFA
ncbi:precorrin-3B synthase [Fortiea contorta]|uniref:precorrin-3B synthase n=1 Tax=Fortiea contorta TaxID=1892405 RepID=UPI00037A2F41|nr:precorrin-3B synthase [Fortiea contorta]